MKKSPFPLYETDLEIVGHYIHNPPPESITVIDKPCGTGKTTALLKGLDPARKYLVIVPLLTEVERVKGEAVVPFFSPDNSDVYSTKTQSLQQLLLEGRNVVTTHTLYTIIAKMALEGDLKGYDIIIDEVLSVVRQVKGVSATSWQRFYVDLGYVEVDEVGKVSTTPKWEEEVEEVGDTLVTKLYALATTDSLHIVDGRFFLECLPPELLQSGLTITIYTYLAEGSMMLAYLKKLGIRYHYQRDVDEDRRFRARAKELITVKSISSLEKIAFSYSKQCSSDGRTARDKKVAKSLMNLRQRELQETPLGKVMITCVKKNWYLNGNSDDPKPTAFSKGSRMFKAQWVANTTRGTNDYIQVRTAVYLWDQHMNPYIRRWLGLVNDPDANDRYATTELVQWLYRTAVRNGEPVTLYMPSKRMRRLLSLWLDAKDLDSEPPIARGDIKLDNQRSNTCPRGLN